MESIVLVSLNTIDLIDLIDGETYSILFDKPRSEVLFPGPKYVKRGKPFNDTIEYYSEILTHLDKQVIPMKYRGTSRVRNSHMFEIDVKSVLRDRKLNELLGE